MRFGETQIKEIENVQSKVSLSRKRSFIMFFFEKEMACGSCLAKHATYVSLLLSFFKYGQKMCLFSSIVVIQKT